MPREIPGRSAEDREIWVNFQTEDLDRPHPPEHSREEDSADRQIPEGSLEVGLEDTRILGSSKAGVLGDNRILDSSKEAVLDSSREEDSVGKAAWGSSREEGSGPNRVLDSSKAVDLADRDTVVAAFHRLQLPTGIQAISQGRRLQEEGQVPNDSSGLPDREDWHFRRHSPHARTSCSTCSDL